MKSTRTVKLLILQSLMKHLVLLRFFERAPVSASLVSYPVCTVQCYFWTITCNWVITQVTLQSYKSVYKCMSLCVCVCVCLSVWNTFTSTVVFWPYKSVVALALMRSGQVDAYWVIRTTTSILHTFVDICPSQPQTPYTRKHSAVIERTTSSVKAVCHTNHDYNFVTYS